MSQLKDLGEFTFTSRYAKYLPELKRRETEQESFQRSKKMHVEKYGHIPEVLPYIDKAFEQVEQKRITGSQRMLQFAGKAIFQHNARGYNCLGKSTKFITSEGVKSFEEYKDGDVITVLTHTGKWQKATVRYYGKDYLYPIIFTRNGLSQTVWATKDHRWLLQDQSVTTQLSVGDKILQSPNIFTEFKYDNANPDEKLYWCYGYVFGDGFVTSKRDNYKQYLVRLCGPDKNYKTRFEETGFSTTSLSLSFGDDCIALTGSYLKIVPDPKKDDPRLIKAWVRGYLDADGEKNKNSNDNLFLSIKASGTNHIDAIRRLFGVAGVYLISEKELTGQSTNTIKFRIINSFDSKFTVGYSVESIDKPEFDECWCLEVEEDESFVLDNGIVTGNCSASYCNRLRFFQEAEYLLLCGSGVGFSVQRHHIACLPDFQHLFVTNKHYVIPDSIEGWCDALGVLLSSYFANPIFPEYANSRVTFHYNEIRPKGSPFSHGCGKAPGPEPIRKALEKIRSLLDRCVSNGQVRLRPIDAYDIVMYISDAVLSGGIRRSATICIFSHDDEDMMRAKTGNWYITNPQRARSNNSALLLRGKVARSEFDKLIQYTRQFGEPGFYWADSLEAVPNPCLTGDTKLLTKDGWYSLKELYDKQQEIEIICDQRIGSKDQIFNSSGTIKRKSSKVKLTQKQSSIYQITTSDGHKIKATDNHEFPTLNGRLKLSDLKVGDILFKQSGVGGFGQSHSFEEGFILGMIVGDGFVSKANKQSYIDIWEDDFELADTIEQYINNITKDIILKSHGNTSLKWIKQSGSTNKNKKRIGGVRVYKWLEQLGLDPHTIKDRVPDCVFKGSQDFVRGYLQGVVVTDGSVFKGGMNTKESIYLRISSTKSLLLEDIQILLDNFGISSQIYLNRRKGGNRILPDGKGGKATYYCQALHEINLNRESVDLFAKRIGLVGPKMSKLQSLLDQRKTLNFPKPNHYQTKIIDIRYVGKEDVYCLYEPISNSFIANGLCVGNCVEIQFYCYDTTQQGWTETAEFSGWQMCNLSSINGSLVHTPEDFYKAATAAATTGTLQAGYDSFPYLGPITERIVRREALIGVSINGIMDSPTILLDPETLKKAAELIKTQNKKIAKIIGINPAARTTCEKPEGTSSTWWGCGSGCHYWHSPNFMRRVQETNLSPIVNYYRKYNPKAVQQCVQAKGNDSSIIFCCKAPNGAKFKKDFTPISFLEAVKTIQENWVRAGKNPELCTRQWLQNNVSNTVSVPDNEWAAVADYIYANQEYFSGISLLSTTGDRDYNQAPFVEVLSPDQIVKEYGESSLFASGIIESALYSFGDLWDACSCVLGIGEQLTNQENPDVLRKIECVGKINKFAHKYMSGDLKRTTYLLKDVYNWKLWIDLTKEHKKVNYQELIELDNNTTQTQVVACGGGACLT